MPESRFEELVVAYKPLALSIAKHKCLGTQYDEDIRAAAIEGLVVGCKQVCDEGITEPAKRIGVLVYRYVLEALRLRPVVSIKNTKLFKMLKSGQDVSLRIIHDNDILDNLSCGNGKIHIDTIEELIIDLKLTQFQTDVLSLRLEGLDSRTIAQKLNASQTWVMHNMMLIRRKYKKVLANG